MISQCRSIPYTKLKTHKNNGWGVGGGGGRGPGEKPYGRGDEIEKYGGSQPGQKS